MRRIWRNYRFEIVLAVLILLGFFLLVERFNIRQTVWLWLSAAGRGVINGIAGAITGLFDFLANRTASDLTGLGLIVVAAGLLIWRTRWRIIRSPAWSDKACPRCGQELHRIHRAPGDRLIGWFLPVRRYLCKNPDCGWTGLRINTSHRTRRKSTATSEDSADLA